uniref:Pentatricopeptide repeat-containing protein n=1 Tax=Gongylonema pulchrum TaxID=637853 RepID=A0A183DLT5_9BILA
LQTYHLMRALHFDEGHNFHLNYMNVFCKALGYDGNDRACLRITSDCLKNCSRKDPELARVLKILIRKNSLDASQLQDCGLRQD